jgi:hypothetical protein
MRRCVGPQRAGHFGLRAYDDVTEAGFEVVPFGVRSPADGFATRRAEG